MARQQTVALCAVLAAAYVLLGRLTFAVSVEYGNVTSVVFAPEGVALAFCILFGPRVAPGIVLGQVILSLWSGPSLLGGMFIGFTNAAEGVLGGWLFRRWAISPLFNRPRDVALFVAMVFLILQPVSATGGVLVLYLLGAIPADIIPAGWAPWWVQGLQKPLPSLDLVPSAWVHWWIGNSVGQLLVAPLILAWSETPATRASATGGLDFALSAGGIALVAALALSGFPTHPLLLLAVTYFLLVWIGLRRGLRGITLANVLIGAAVTWAGASGEGFMSHLTVADRLSNVGFFVAAACIVSLMLFAMFEEREILIARLTRLASWDSLVELHNRRYFIETAEREVAASQRYGRDLVLLMLDADNFKQLNDRHGHAAGDAALKMIAHVCATVARRSDVTGRIGGEEFALLLPQATLEAGQILAERLRAQISATPVPVGAALNLHVTVSIGIARLGGRENLDALMGAADKALYAAKRAGRNRAALAD
ncbi:sensor domain-containing diguanylate cyclase [Xanthobacter dioxanivorans]|nr:diguanylate cyclase [Xanthobacter dioxanivorans]